MATLVLLRHGQSTWNLDNIFTGWQDPDLTEAGRAEARRGGEAMKEHGIAVDVVHTSMLRRAIMTAAIALDAADRHWVPAKRHWRLNERHYGALQGLDKAATLAEHGDEQFLLWRRSYSVAPPPVGDESPHHPRNDPRYDTVPRELLPASECLEDVLHRVLPYWYDSVVPDLFRAQTVLIAAHGNSLRALAKYVMKISDTDIVKLEIPTGKPWVFELDEQLEIVSERYL